MASNRRLPAMVICCLILLFALGCGFPLVQPTPIVVVQEVTRVVVVTATPTQTPVIIVVTATPDNETTVSEEMPIAAPSPEGQPPAIVDGMDDPVAGLAALSKVAQGMQSQGIHTLRLKMDLSVPIEVTIRDQQQVDESLTSLVRNELSNYRIQGNYVIDVSVDDLVQQKWVIEAMGGVTGLGNEEMTELQQSGDKIWEKDMGGEWSLRELTPDEAPLPLGNSLVAIDAYSHALNLSDLVIDALRPLLLTGDGEQSAMGQNYGWTAVTGAPSIDGLLEMQRERAMSSSNNLEAVTASMANSGLSAYADPAAVTNGLQQITSAEKAWFAPDTRLVDHSQVEVRGKGVIEVTYLMQQRFLDATVTMSTANSFEYLPSVTIITVPEQ
jgi:hypothetical protein